MNFVKKNIKWIITIVGTIVITTGISVYATGQYLASQVDYNKNGQAKVSDALDDLYSKVPSGTKTITEKANNIDVSRYQYADTTNLYTESEVVLGKDSGYVLSNDTFSVNNLNFRPTEIWLYIYNQSNGGKVIVHADDNGGEYWAVLYGTKYYGSQPITITDNGFSLTLTNWANSSVNWTATK